MWAGRLPSRSDIRLEFRFWYKPLWKSVRSTVQAEDPQVLTSSASHPPLGLPQGYWDQTLGGEEQLPTVGMALSTTTQGRGETEGIGLGSPACSRRGQPFLLSLHLVRCACSLLTAQLENVTSLERFPRALPGSQPPRQAPLADLFFANPAASWMAGRLPAQRIVSGEPPRRWLGHPGLDASARVPAGGSGGAPRGSPPRVPAAARPRAYLCGPGRSRGRHPVV